MQNMKIKDYLKYVPYKWGVEIADYDNRKNVLTNVKDVSEVDSKFYTAKCEVIYKDYQNKKVVFGVKVAK